MKNRDFTTASSAALATKPKLKGLHWVLLSTGLLIAGGMFALLSVDGQVMRQETIAGEEDASPQISLALPSRSSLAAQATESVASPAAGTHQVEEITVRNGDTLARIFQRVGLTAQQLYSIMQASKETDMLKSLLPGQKLIFSIDADNQLRELIYRIDLTRSLKIIHNDGQIIASSEARTPELRPAQTSGVITHSFYHAGQKAGLNDAQIMEVANIFGWDIDFALDIRENDSFSVLYDEQFLDGRKIGTGQVKAATFTNQGQTYQTVRYTDPEGRTGYFTPDGKSMRKAFLRSPVDFSRISSRFGPRMHPILNRMRAHNGVDYAAPTGTPIKSTGNGRIVFRGVQGGYGNTIIVQHGSQYSTLYAHMSAFKKGLGIGSTIKQGDVIGFIGTSGLSSGPHLHYEFRVNGAYRNPLAIKFPDAEPIKAQHRQHFLASTQPLLAQLERRKGTTLAANDF